MKKKYYRDNQELSEKQWNVLLTQDINAMETKHNITLGDAVRGDLAMYGDTVINQHRYEWYNTTA